MDAAIITIGDEILLGKILDSNSQWIAEKLSEIGVSISEIRSIKDDETDIIQALEELTSKNRMLVFTGGLGATNDDITKKTLATYLKTPLVLNQEILTHIKEILEKKQTPLSELSESQAYMPRDCTPLKNKYGTAPGMWFKHQNKVIITLPGVPYEMKSILETSVIPKLKEDFTLPHIIEKTMLVYGIGENTLANRIEKWETQLPSFLKLAYLPSAGLVKLRLVGSDFDKDKITEAIDMAFGKIKPFINELKVGTLSDHPIEKMIQEECIHRNISLSTSESCTGGTISAKLIAVSGASSFFKGSIVAYHTSVKTNLLSISEEIINKNSVVSETVVKAMAENTKEQLQSTISLAITGNAGPTKDDTLEEVGTIFMAIAKPKGVITQKLNLTGSREHIIEKASVKALEFLYSEIKKHT